MSRADAAFMRGWLIANGVEPPAAGDRDVNQSNVSAETPPHAPDRRRISEILADKAAPWEIDWLVASCPSEQAANQYRSARISWCVDCAGQRVHNELGCIACSAGTT